MHIEWSLILFTVFISWCAGLFSTQAILAYTGQAKKSQMMAWVVSAVLLAIGGLAVFSHLQNWERIFNGFGHITSGITQELIAIVVLSVIAIIYLIVMRRTAVDASLPKWLCVLVVIGSLALIYVMAHSYMMDSRPAWDSYAWLLYTLGNACILGPASMLIIMSINKEECPQLRIIAIVGAAIALLGAVLYAIHLHTIPGSFLEIPFYYDGTNPTAQPLVVAESVSSAAMIIWGAGVVVGGVAPVVSMIVLARTKPAVEKWLACGAIALAAALIGAFMMRVAFYELGYSTFMFF